MAVTSIHSIKATVGAAISYITDGDKTVNGLYVSSYACRADSRGAAEDFRTVRATGTGRTTILAHHIIQSFEPGEITPEQAMQIGEELCNRLLKGDYQYVLAVHSDKKHIHTHIIFNNTNLYNGLSFTTEHNQGKVSERSWAKLREISDEICKEHGLSVIAEPEKSQGISHFEHDMQIQGKSWKDKLRAKIAEVAFYSKSFDDFLQRCIECGIEYVYTPQNKVKLKFRLKDEGQQRFTKADTLGADYTPERIAEQIEHIQKALAVTDKFAEKKAPEKTATTATSKPIETPTVITAGEFINVCKKVEPIESKPIESKPTEIKAPEKKEDMWESIRGMGKADEIITALEAVGITSFTEFSGFMWNTQHSNDHTEELSVLKKKIKAIDMLITKMKHRDELAPTYNEYQGLSGLKQSRYKKKHSEQIEDYEQTTAYIKKHIKPFVVDGKAPKRSDLQDKSANMKAKYNALVKEHNAFLAKKTTAEQYTRTVRSYLNEKRNREAAEKSRQRKLTQQKKKDTLE